MTDEVAVWAHAKPPLGFLDDLGVQIRCGSGGRGFTSKTGKPRHQRRVSCADRLIGIFGAKVENGHPNRYARFNLIEDDAARTVR
jgi:hypothetical protein